MHLKSLFPPSCMRSTSRSTLLLPWPWYFCEEIPGRGSGVTGFHQIPVKEFPRAAMSIATRLANQSWSSNAHVTCVGQYERIESGSICLCRTSLINSWRALGVSRVLRQTPAEVCPAARCECFKMGSWTVSKPIGPISRAACREWHDRPAKAVSCSLVVCVLLRRLVPLHA